ncbi:single-stranded DNA-binding protein [Nocardioides daphniae]|uniref:Single-stranded DNA-binding protein n=1 Tax=Nocardioides daphniae TaxID=402297 RepID=A0A4V1CWJ0_9ACTN|nr:single-stranded DNA-binding protein [Nocardioides daphniae]QCC77437.1 single-stranded DNA-binding protein [Nocardioides daphniae]
MSLHGFIATTPQLHFTSTGQARFYARVGVEHYRREADHTFTKLDSTFHDLVAYAKTAERAYDRFRVGDNFLASATSPSTRSNGTATSPPARSSSRAASATTSHAPRTPSNAHPTASSTLPLQT